MTCHFCESKAVSDKPEGTSGGLQKTPSSLADPL